MPNISLERLPGEIRRLEKRIVDKIEKAIAVTAVKAEKPIKSRVPVAFGELRDSISALDVGSNPVTAVTAPHAGAVEQGSMPHTPDWEKLLAWVRLRGMQGLTGRGKLRNRFPAASGPTTPAQARRVAVQLKGLEVRGKKGIGRHSPIDAAEQVAKAISKSIEQNGTRPHWFVRESLSDIQQILAHEVSSRIKG